MRWKNVGVAILLAPLVACSEPTGAARGSGAPIGDPCGPNGNRVTLPVGGVAPYWGGTAAALCLDGGSEGMEYVVAASNVAPDAAANLVVRAVAQGIEAPRYALASAAAFPPAGVAALAIDASPSAPYDGGFHERLRRREREELTPRMAQARAALEAARAALPRAVASPEIGDLLSFNVQARSACSDPDVRSGRVVALSANAIIVADTGNPPGGFTTADYQQIAATYDTLVVPVVTGAFGRPSDVDGNGRIIIFYTRAVNELTPRGASFVIGGFVFARDLYPRQGQNACAASNFAEMFYMLVPDRDGSINGNARTVEFVRRTTIGVLAHELQHLINAGRRLYETGASSFETIWLDEGLAHIAEELIFQRASGLGSRQNLGAAQITASQQRIDAYNRFQSANITRFETFAKQPERTSAYAANDSLTTRGAAWQLLRFAADRRGGDEASTWRALAGGPATGLANLGAVFGSDVPRLFVQWHVALAVDDAVAALPASYRNASWNLRSVYAMLGRPQYPLLLRTLTAGVPVDVTLAGGGAAYFRLRVPAAESATLELRRADGNAALPTSFAGSIVRTR